jgi:hypothetical protein
MLHIIIFRPVLILASVLFFTFETFGGEVFVDEGNFCKVSLPESFLHEKEDERTVFIMPRKNDENGPISMRLTCLRDIADEKLTPLQVEDLLKETHPNSRILIFGEHKAVTKERDYEDDSGIKWKLTQYTICADNILFTVTIGTVKGRENEAQCKELLDSIPKIFASLKRGKK